MSGSTNITKRKVGTKYRGPLPTSMRMFLFSSICLTHVCDECLNFEMGRLMKINIEALQQFS